MNDVVKRRQKSMHQICKDIIGKAERGFDQRELANGLRIGEGKSHGIDEKPRHDQDRIPAVPGQKAGHKDQYRKEDRKQQAFAVSLVADIINNAFDRRHKIKGRSSHGADQGIVGGKQERREDLKR